MIYWPLTLCKLMLAALCLTTRGHQKQQRALYVPTASVYIRFCPIINNVHPWNKIINSLTPT